jgi:dynein intermediate chain, cytosolic
MVCVWSMILEDDPEFTFTSHSPVLTARFHPGDPHLVLGGCYSGQIVMWDTRVASSRPTMRSSFAGKGHKHPVFSMVIERSNRSNAILITASTDGQLCHWDISNLSEPISTTNLMGMVMAPYLPSTEESLPTAVGNKRAISPSCMTLGPIEDKRKVGCIIMTMLYVTRGCDDVIGSL